MFYDVLCRLEWLNLFEIQGASDQGPVNMAQGDHPGGWRLTTHVGSKWPRLLTYTLMVSHMWLHGQHVWICNILRWLSGWKVTRTSYTSPGDVRNSWSSWCLTVLVSQHIGPSRPCSWRCPRASAWGGNWGRDGHREKASRVIRGTCHLLRIFFFLRGWMVCQWSPSWFWEVCFLPGFECTSSCDGIQLQNHFGSKSDTHMSSSIII